MRVSTVCLLVSALTLGGGCGGDPPGDGPGSTFTTTRFAGAGKCSGCHDGLTDGAGQDVSIAADWSSTMMANSSRDPFWRAKVASELRRAPGLESVVHEKCSRCHAPMASVESVASGSEPRTVGGFLEPSHPLYPAAMDGVSCTLCHQIQDTGKLGTLEASSGHFTIGSYGNPVARPLYGQYTDPRPGPMRNRVQYTPTHGPHMVRSEMCASCHDLKTPFVNAKNEVVSTTPESEFPEQMVYSEWKHSDFALPGGQTCANCHLPRADGVTIASWPNDLPTRIEFGRHVLVGGNTTMLDLLDRNRAALGVTATGFAATIARTRESLASSAALQITSTARSASQLELTVSVENRSGHKLPSGYPSRRVWLHVTVQDSTGVVVFESGRMNDDGSIAGVDADSSLSSFEPHHDEISQADQVQVYEAIMGDTDGQVTYTLLRGAQYLKDNRLLPRGFDKATAPRDVAVAGEASADTSFAGGGDVVRYRIPVGAGALSVTVALRYQAMAHGFLQDLYRDEDDAAIAQFKALYGASTLRAETITSTTAQIP